jgi:hypothetical protein
MNDKNLKKDLALVEYDSDEQMTLEVGVNYQGSFRINPNGTIKVRPYKVGSKPGNLTKKFEADNYCILASRRIVRVVFTFDRCERERLAAKFKDALLECYQTLRTISL